MVYTLLIILIIGVALYYYYIRTHTKCPHVSPDIIEMVKVTTNNIVYDPVDVQYYRDNYEPVDEPIPLPAPIPQPHTRVQPQPEFIPPTPQWRIVPPFFEGLYRPIRDEYDIPLQGAIYDTLHYDRYQRHNIENMLHNDEQNVHDRVVQQQIIQQYNDINDVPTHDTADIRREIVDVATRMGKDRDEIDNVVGEIIARNANVMNLNNNEVGVLTTTWSTGNDNVREQIIENLLDARNSRGHIVCPTGVVTRIVEASLIETPENMPKTANTLRVEMLNKASKLKVDFDKMEPNLSDDDRTRKFTELLVTTFTDDYKNIIPRDDVINELNTWVNDI